MKILSKSIALTLVIAASPVGAQDADNINEAPVLQSYSYEAPTNVPNTSTDGSDTPDTHCYSSLCSGDTETLDVYAGIVRAGTAAGMFDAGEHGYGEAGASSDGVDTIDLGVYRDTCDEVCQSNRLTASLTANQRNQSYAWGVSEQSGQPVTASTLGVNGITVTYGAGFDACPGGCTTTESPVAGTDD